MGVSEGHSRTRLIRFVALCLVAVFVFSFVIPQFQPARAQGDDQGAAAKPAEKKGTDSVFVSIITSVGWFFLALGPVSIALVALIVLASLDLRLTNCIPPDFVEEFTDTVNKRKFKEAFELAKNDTSFVGRVLTAGMGRLQYGIDDARETAFSTVESVRAGKEQILTYMATIGTLGPMIGLVGTVFGMIRTFMVLGQGGSPEPSKLATGISEALAITLLGIALAVPAIFFHAFFRNRLIRIANECSAIADDLITQMYHFSRKPAAAESRPAAAPSANAEARPAAAIKPAT